MASTTLAPESLDVYTVDTPPDHSHPDQVNMEVIFFLSVVLTGVLCLFGFVGNVVAFIALCKDPHKSSYVYLLSSLCIADWFMLLSLFNGVVIIKFCRHYSLPQHMGGAVLPVMWGLGCIVQTTAIWLVVAVTWDRFIAVCWPFMRKRTNPISCAKKLIAGVVIFAIVFNIPRFFHYHPISGSRAITNVNCSDNYTYICVMFEPGVNISLDNETQHGNSYLQYSNNPKNGSSIIKLHTNKENDNKLSGIMDIYNNVTESSVSDSYLHNNISNVTESYYKVYGDWEAMKETDPPMQLQHSRWYHYIYYITLSWLVMYIVPLITLLVLNVMLLRHIHIAKQNHAKLAKSHKEQESLSVTMNVVAIVTVFIICQAPDFVFTLISYPTLGVNRPVQEYMRSLAYAFQALNSSLNFIIYSLFYKRFRRTVLNMFCHWNPFMRRKLSLEFLSIMDNNTALTSHQATENSSRLSPRSPRQSPRINGVTFNKNFQDRRNNLCTGKGENNALLSTHNVSASVCKFG